MYDKITLPALISLLSDKTGKSKKLCEDFLRELFNIITETLTNGENIKIKSIGTFKIVDVEARKSVNVNTGEEMEIPGHRKVVFVPAKQIAEDVNSPFAMFETVEIDDKTLTEQKSEDTEPLTPSTVIDTEAEIPNAPSDQNQIIIPEETCPFEGETEKPQDTEVLQEEPDEEEPYEESFTMEPGKRNFKFMWGFLSGVACMALIAIIGYLFLADKFNEVFRLNSVQNQATVTNPKLTVDSTDNDTQTATDTIYDSGVNINGPVDVISDADEKDIAPTLPSDEKVYDTISKTRYLTTMAKAHYGDYLLWPYIYEENKSFLGHPDRIPPGTRVVIPPLSKYGVDPTNPEHIKRAREKGLQIYARYN